MSIYRERIQEWVVITWMDSHSLVALDELNPKKFYWGGTPSWCTFGEDTKIVRSYGFISNDNSDMLDAVTVDYYKSFDVPVAKVKASGGWLSPKGEFYPCRYGLHISLAHQLAGIYYSELGNGGGDLEAYGWLHIADEGYIFKKAYYNHVIGDVKPNDKQLETLLAISQLEWEDEIYKENFTNYLKDLTEEE